MWQADFIFYFSFPQKTFKANYYFLFHWKLMRHLFLFIKSIKMLIFWFWHMKKINEATFIFIQVCKRDKTRGIWNRCGRDWETIRVKLLRLVDTYPGCSHTPNHPGHHLKQTNKQFSVRVTTINQCRTRSILYACMNCLKVYHLFGC